ncbi:subtilisin-like protease SBT3.9 [Hordeum vulgare subsp. vulgare]|uniref:Subtilisin-like protease n=1 Tax=Hordeum vulgare subsp. vulgare TaxID=112509 RepID=A0A8I6Z1K9_HORVV|nr:subtilisin-like protease SBT3.9 [Hordeum vulgare subsp. vulgare]
MDSRTAFCAALLLATLLPLSANASSKLYIVYMGEKKHDDPSVVMASHHDMLTSVFGSKDEALMSIVYSYKHGFSGFAAMLTKSQAEAIAKFPEVVSVKPNTFHQTHTTRSWDFLGLDHNQPAHQLGLLKKAKYGEDIIVGVIDSGIWPESRSFDDNGYGPVPARWKGKCQSGQKYNATGCNRKIIGARWYGRGISAESLKRDYKSPRDMDGHGTHVASTIAGGEVQGVSYRGLGKGVARGGAPRARLGIYKVCWVDQGCPDAAVLAAIDDAIHDGVDVLSLSVGLAGHEFSGSLHAVQRGISVVFAGGNDGPVPQTVTNAVPWVTTVAASTIDRSFPTLISLGNKEKLVGQSLNYNAAMNNSGFQDLVHAGRCDTESLALSNVTGKTVLCYAPAQAATTPPRAVLSRFINRTIEAGAKGLIFAQYTVNLLEILTSCEGFMPCAVVDFEIAQRIASYWEMTENPVVKISPAESIVGNGVLSPIVAMFSSRGPSPAFPGILKPDVTAPGVSILAAERDSYVFKSGTSMACPHVSAVTAMLKSVHRDWSPAMIKSAIVTTAYVTDRFGMPIQANGVPRKLADPFDFGGGHMDPERAVDPGLVYDLDAREYNKLFNCTLELSDGCKSYNLNLNLPSITVPDLMDHVILQRTVTNVGPAEATYHLVTEAPAGIDVSVEPSVINFTQGGSRRATFTVTFKTRQRVQGGYTFGSLTWSDGSTHSVRIPVAIRTVIQDFVADTA